MRRTQPRRRGPAPLLASVQSLERDHVQVICPYCGRPHTHLLDGARPGTTIHRAPGCGLVRSDQQRLAGYRITLIKGARP